MRTILSHVGEQPERQGLCDTPARFLRAMRDEWCAGYAQDPAELLACTFDETAKYGDMVVLSDIRFESHCEHHLAPIIGVAHVGYIPTGRVVGISKLARVVDVYAKRLQIQERMTVEIATAIEDALRPAGVAVMVEGEHHCMTTRGVQKPGTTMTTSAMRGVFALDTALAAEFRSRTAR